MDIKNILTSAIVAVIVLGVGSSLVGNSPVVEVIDRTIDRTVTNNVGAVSGPVTGQLFALGAFSQGGQIRATSTSNSTETLLAADMLEYSIIDYTPNVAAVTLTLPATSTWTGVSLIENAGSQRTWIIRNATSTSAINITVAAGTGIELIEPDGQNVVIGPDNYARLTCHRKADTDVVCLVDEAIAAD